MTGNKEILFVTFRDESFDVGLSYATYLAGMLGEKLRVLLIGKDGILDKVGKAMPVAAYAESMQSTGNRSEGRDPDSALMHLRIMSQCEEAGVKASIHTRLSGSVSAIREFLARPGIDMVLLSPTVSQSGDFARSIVKESKRPIVTITQWNGASASTVN